jgi:hypothetical protein
VKAAVAPTSLMRTIMTAERRCVGETVEVPSLPSLGSGDELNQSLSGRAIKMTPEKDRRPARSCLLSNGWQRNMEQAYAVKSGMRKLRRRASAMGRYWRESGFG